MSAAGFEPAIPASEQTCELESAADGIGTRASVKELTHHSFVPSEGRSCRTFHLSLRLQKNKNTFVLIIIISNLSNDRSKASSKTIPPHSAI